MSENGPAGSKPAEQPRVFGRRLLEQIKAQKAAAAAKAKELEAASEAAKKAELDARKGGDDEAAAKLKKRQAALEKMIEETHQLVSNLVKDLRDALKPGGSGGE